MAEAKKLDFLEDVDRERLVAQLKHMERGQRIRMVRALMGMSQTEFAEALDKTRPTVSAWETGVHGMGQPSAAKVAMAVGIPYEILREKTEDLPDNLMERAKEENERIKARKDVEKRSKTANPVKKTGTPKPRPRQIPGVKRIG